MNKTLWIVAAAAALLAIFAYVEVQRARERETTKVESVTEAINSAAEDMDRAVDGEVPADANVAELSRHLARYEALTRRTDELAAMMRENVVRAKGDAGDRFRAAMANYEVKHGLIGPRLTDV